MNTVLSYNLKENETHVDSQEKQKQKTNKPQNQAKPSQKITTPTPENYF